MSYVALQQVNGIKNQNKRKMRLTQTQTELKTLASANTCALASAYDVHGKFTVLWNLFKQFENAVFLLSDFSA